MRMPEIIELDHPDNLHLLRLGPNDAETLRAYTNTNSVIDPRTGVQEMSEYRSQMLVRHYIEEMERGERAPYTIRNAQGAMVGEVGLYNHRVDYALAEYSVADHMRRRHVASVAISTLIEQGQQAWDLTRVGFLITKDNEASRALARSIGVEYKEDWHDTRDEELVMQYWEKAL